MLPVVSRRAAVTAVVVIAAQLFALVPPASAQYFGQNKIQYRTFDFQLLQTQHFDIYFYPAEREGVEISARLAERWYARLQRLLNHDLRKRQPLVLYASHVDFEQTNIIEGPLGEGTGGVTEPVKRRIVLPLAGPLADTDHVIGHELVHAFQFDITSNPGAPPGLNGAERLPLWFIEGMAEYLSIGPVDSNTAMWLRDAVREEKLPSIKDLDHPKYFPYRWGQAFWAYVAGRWGDHVIKEMLSVGGVAGVEVAFSKVLGMSRAQVSADWQAATRRAYEPILASTSPPSETGRLITKPSEVGGDLNVGPSISPDGRWVAYLSSRSYLSIDLYVAEASSGRIVRKLTSTGTDPHFASIQFIYSAGAWDRTSTRLALATIVSGHPALAVFNAQNGKKEREIPIGTVDEIFNPTWAPDGHALCFTGMSSGLTDLYVYDFRLSTLRRLTSDAYADLQPAWSPDGRRIAFATDRFTTQLDTLDIGPHRLGLIDVDSGRIDQVRTFTEGQDISPQWSADGTALFFISNRDGIPNLYRVNLSDEGLVQLTTVGTGVSGITSTSPALSVSQSTGRAVLSVYDRGNYAIYVLDPTDRMRPIAALPGGAKAAATLPAVDRQATEDVPMLLADASFGLPPPASFTVESYKARLSLEAVSQPTIGVGVDRFGAALGGGIALQFGDFLGNHVLVLGGQFDSGIGGGYSFQNTSVQVGYLDRSHRWNYGVIGGQVPYLSGGFASSLGNYQGEPAEIQQTIIFRQTERSGSGFAAYPINRAKRVEIQAGVSQIAFDQVIETSVYSLNTGDLLNQNTRTVEVASTLNLGTTAAAFVHDTASFGPTSPVQGQRYRFEATPTFGTLNFTGLLADYRRYFMPAPFYTIAGRIMSYGRYGSGGQDSRLYPLYIGYPNLVRGYDINTFNSAECIVTPTGSCPAFDRLLGSRVLVGNVEFRFPLLRPAGVSQRMYGPVPMEIAFFADSGVAWNSGEKPAFLGGTRENVSSAGVTLRANVFGFLIAEFDVSRPFERPGQGWVFQFNFSPGF